MSVLELGDLRGDRPGQRRRCRGRAFARALATEKAEFDGRAGAGERQERDGDVRILDRERERGAHLIAVERAVAGAAHPARALPRPFARCRRSSPGSRVAGLVAA